MTQEPNAISSEMKNPADCDAFYRQRVEEWKKDPNNYIYDYRTNTVETAKKESAEYHIWKRRQRTKNGSENPKSPCDDDGLPLFVDARGNLTTQPDGNQPVWGDWVDGSEVGVSVRGASIPRNCRPFATTRILTTWSRYPWSEDSARRAIEDDKEAHDRQQARKKNKVQVEYDARLVKKEKSYPVWNCEVRGVKARDYPDDWMDAKYEPQKHAVNPIIISFRARYKEYNPQTEKFVKKEKGVGNFKGRRWIVGDIEKGEMFGLYELERGLVNGGFVPSGLSKPELISELHREEFEMPVPNSDDACLISTRWNAYFSSGMKYFSQSRLRLLDEEGRKAIGGGLSSAYFNVAKKGGEAWRDNYYVYEKKAPKESVKFCHDKFDEVVKNAVVMLVDEIDLT